MHVFFWLVSSYALWRNLFRFFIFWRSQSPTYFSSSGPSVQWNADASAPGCHLKNAAAETLGEPNAVVCDVE